MLHHGGMVTVRLHVTHHRAIHYLCSGDLSRQSDGENCCDESRNASAVKNHVQKILWVARPEVGKSPAGSGRNPDCINPPRGATSSSVSPYRRCNNAFVSRRQVDLRMRERARDTPCRSHRWTWRREDSRARAGQEVVLPSCNGPSRVGGNRVRRRISASL